jgi:hypothetical protein
MDPIHPIVPGPTPITDRLPVQPIERVSRERDRPSSDQRRRRPAPRQTPPERDEEDEDGRPHVDVCA